MDNHDPATGEVLDGRAATPPELRAANGDVLAPPSNSTGTFLDLLEDGDFSAEAHEQLRELARALKIHANNGVKATGKATITLNFESDGEAMHVRADIKVKAPELPRRKSIVWTDDNDNFCRFPPRQVQMFGGRKPRVIS